MAKTSPTVMARPKGLAVIARPKAAAIQRLDGLSPAQDSQRRMNRRTRRSCALSGLQHEAGFAFGNDDTVGLSLRG